MTDRSVIIYDWNSPCARPLPPEKVQDGPPPPANGGGPRDNGMGWWILLAGAVANQGADHAIASSELIAEAQGGVLCLPKLRRRGVAVRPARAAHVDCERNVRDGGKRSIDAADEIVYAVRGT